jgi:hypothetical protein
MRLIWNVSRPGCPKSCLTNPVVTLVVTFRSRSNVGNGWEFGAVSRDGGRVHTFKIVVNGHKRQLTFAKLITGCEISHRSFEHFLLLLFYSEETFPPASMRVSGRFS